LHSTARGSSLQKVHLTDVVIAKLISPNDFEYGFLPSETPGHIGAWIFAQNSLPYAKALEARANLHKLPEEISAYLTLSY